MMSKVQETEWSQINWVEIQRKVATLQNKIYEATLANDVAQRVQLQKTLINSYNAKLLAVRRVTQDNKGKNTAGIDEVKSIEPENRVKLAERLELNGEATCLRRVYIPKPGKNEKRPLGIPVMEDRAKQALAKMALEPEWEARFEPNSYGFRPGRGAHDAIEAIELSIRRKEKFVLDADLKGCFDNIDHEALIRKLMTFPKMEKQIRAWLKAGVLEGEVFHETERGTPQGGVISPLLANIALHGFETYITSMFPKRQTKIGMPKGKKLDIGEARVIRYADDFVILHSEKEVIEEAKKATIEWMSGIGLKLNDSKTKICHTKNECDGNKPGFDFLGFHLQTYAAGKYRSNKKSNGEPLMMITKVTPSEKSIESLKSKVRGILNKGHSEKPKTMIIKLNWLLRGWYNYFKVCSHLCDVKGGINSSLYLIYLNWGQKKFPKKGNGYITGKIFHKNKGSNWNFGWEVDGELCLAASIYDVEYIKHIKVRDRKSPYDGDWMYWASRRGEHPLAPRDIKFGIKRQKGRCYLCKEIFLVEDSIDVHHLDGNRANNCKENKVLLHRHCHHKVHGNSGVLASNDALSHLT